MTRTLAVTRMHLTDRMTLFVLPPSILAASFLVNLLIFAAEPVGSRTTGGVAAIYVVVLVASVMLTARSMVFALSMGASRRSFALGTGLTGLVFATVFGALLLVGERIERATGGWWLHGRFFGFGWLERDLAGAWLLASLLLLTMFLLGAWVSTIWLRWRQVGVLVAGISLVVVLGGLGALVTWTGGWSAVGGWFERLTPLSAAGWTALACVPLAGASYLAMRGVEP